MLDGGWQTMEGAASPIPSPSFDSEAQRMSLNPVMQLEVSYYNLLVHIITCYLIHFITPNPITYN